MLKKIDSVKGIDWLHHKHVYKWSVEVEQYGDKYVLTLWQDGIGNFDPEPYYVDYPFRKPRCKTASDEDEFKKFEKWVSLIFRVVIQKIDLGVNLQPARFKKTD